MSILLRSTVRVYSPVNGGLKTSTRLISSLAMGHLAVLHTGSVQSLEVFQKKAPFSANDKKCDTKKHTAERPELRPPWC